MAWTTNVKSEEVNTFNELTKTIRNNTLNMHNAYDGCIIDDDTDDEDDNNTIGSEKDGSTDNSANIPRKQ